VTSPVVAALQRETRSVPIVFVRIDRRVGAGQHIGNPPLVSNVGLDRLKTRIIGTEEFATAVRMP
jgi:hypothetical protein